MKRLPIFVRVVVPGLLTSLAGCQGYKGWQTKQAPGPAVVDAEPEAPPAVEEEPADLHRAATLDDVQAFLDRLAKAAAPDESGETVQQPGPGPIRHTSHEPQSAGTAVGGSLRARVNMPLDVREVGQALATSQAPAEAPPASPVIESVFIPNALGDNLVEADPQTTQTTNSPLSATDPPRGKLSVDQWMAALAERTQEHPEDTVAQWELRLLQLAIGDEEAARTPSEDASSETAELLCRLIEAIIATRDALEHPVTASEAALGAVEALRTPLQEQADLQIPTVALCTRVQTFGVYDEMPSGALVANRPNRAIVYIEIGNFLSEQTDDGRYRTMLSDELEILTPDGRSVWHKEEPSIVDLSRRRRHDFFLAQIIDLPNTLGPGEYVLKVSMQDDLSGKSNQAIHRFSIGSSSIAQAPR